MDTLLSDKVLVAMSVTGDADAFNTLCVRYRPKLRRFLQSRRVAGASIQDAEDIVQDTLLKAMSGIYGFRGDCSFSTWLHAIAKNEAYRHYAHERIHSVEQSKRVDIEDHIVADDEVQVLANCRTPELYLEAKQEISQVVAKVSALPDDCKTAFCLYTVELMSYEEIAVRLGIAIGTVRSRIHRARERLGLLKHSLS